MQRCKEARIVRRENLGSFILFVLITTQWSKIKTMMCRVRSQVICLLKEPDVQSVQRLIYPDPDHVSETDDVRSVTSIQQDKYIGTNIESNLSYHQIHIQIQWIRMTVTKPYDEYSSSIFRNLRLLCNSFLPSTSSCRNCGRRH
jgi:hypothetical protein